MREQSREILFTMKDETIPRGVVFSQLLMAMPLLGCTAVTCLLAPMAIHPQFVDPAQFSYLARTSLRLLTLNVGFNAGIHYGMGAAMYDLAQDETEKARIRK